MGMFLLRATWAHEYMAIFVKMYGHRTSGRFKRAGDRWFKKKIGQHVNKMIAVAGKIFWIFADHVFL